MHRYVVVYDIVKNRTRKVVSDILEGYGVRVNKSVFECMFKTERQKQQLFAEILHEIDTKTDSVRVYAICKNCLSNSHALGEREEEPFTIDSVYFVS